MKIKSIQPIKIKTGFLPRKFGRNFAQISTKNLLRLKSAIKDVARFKLGEVTLDIEKVCEDIVPPPQGVEDLDYLFGYKQDDGKEVKGYFHSSEALQYYSKKYPDQWEIVLKALKIRRSTGRHASGFLIADKPLDTFIPLMTVSGVRCTQYTASGCEESGGLKIDILTVNSLKDIESALKLIHDNAKMAPKEDTVIIDGKRVPSYRVVPFQDKLYDIWDLPDSKEVFDQIASGETETLFQLGTNSARKGLKSFNIFDDKEDGGAFIALDRPGPLDARVESGNGSSRNMLEEYAARAKNMPKYGEIHYLTQVLPETYGIIVYQENLTKVYKDLTGCSGAEAEAFRGDISKKKMTKVMARYTPFIEAASKKVGEEVAKSIWEQIVTFGQYGFNKSHAFCYFYISYATAFLKKFYPLEWWCAVLQNASKDEIVTQFWPHCKDFVVLPDIRISKNNFYIKDNKIVAPLSLIKGLGPKAQAEISDNIPYTDLKDFCDKIANRKTKATVFDAETGKAKAGLSALNVGVVNKLIISGVMDSLFEKTDLLTKLETYQAQLAISLNKKRPEKVKEQFQLLDPIQIYQYRKQLLEIYSSFLAPVFYTGKVSGIERKTMGTEAYYVYHPINDAKIISSLLEQMGSKHMFKPLPIVNGKQFYELNESATLYENQVLRIAVAAYVEEEKSFKFQKKEGGRPTGIFLSAKKYKLDIDGVTQEVVKWPDYNTNKLVSVKEDLTGCMVVAVLSKKKENVPFKLDAIIKTHNKLEE